MKFELLPVMDLMLDLYQKPRTFERFQDYLTILQGPTKGDLALPIGGFNPMAKEHILQKLTELKELKVEQLIENTLIELNSQLTTHKTPTIFKVAFNLSDDLQGGWTNHFTSDYDSKFKLNALMTRNFCVPVFWVSENYAENIIIQRTLEYGYRTIGWLSHPKPTTLQEHIFQEKMVAKKVKSTTEPFINVETLHSFYQANKDSTDYSVIFNFLYGDAATASLGNNPLGIKEEMAGYKFARWLASQEEK